MKIDCSIFSLSGTVEPTRVNLFPDRFNVTRICGFRSARLAPGLGSISGQSSAVALPRCLVVESVQHFRFRWPGTTQYDGRNCLESVFESVWCVVPGALNLKFFTHTQCPLVVGCAHITQLAPEKGLASLLPTAAPATTLKPYSNRVSYTFVHLRRAACQNRNHAEQS